MCSKKFGKWLMYISGIILIGILFVIWYYPGYDMAKDKSPNEESGSTILTLNFSPYSKYIGGYYLFGTVVILAAFIIGFILQENKRTIIKNTLMPILYFIRFFVLFLASTILGWLLLLGKAPKEKYTILVLLLLFVVVGVLLKVAEEDIKKILKL